MNSNVSTLAQECLNELHQHVLPYWMNNMVDHEHGGFYGRRDAFDTLEPKASKGSILNARILWTFSSAARHYKNPRYLEMAHRAYQYYMDFFVDPVYGGVYWMLDYQGKPIQTKKQIYAQAFAMYAMVEYYLATQEKESLDQAIKLFELIEKHSFDVTESGYLEAFDEQWNLLEDLRLSDKDANEKKTMNTHLHVIEAYTLLYTVWKDARLKKQLRNLLMIFTEKIINKNYQYDLFFNERWELQSRATSFGHDIEGSWLLCEAAYALGDLKITAAIEKIAVLTVDKVLRDGLDDDGGLINETEPEGPTDTDKHWWPQAEALVGLVNVWQITKNPLYLDKAGKVWNFIKKFVRDEKHGEWHWLLSRSGEVKFKEDKAGPWKCPYHNGRALIEIGKRLEGMH